MSKFKLGETSKGVVAKKNAITKLILLKSDLLRRVTSYETIPATLERKGKHISEGAVHRWQDDELGIYCYARNTAYAKHNEYALKSLLSELQKANARLDQCESPKHDNGPSNAVPTYDKRLNELAAENVMLKTALSEVYRAYMQILDRDREDKQIDDAYRKMILQQTQILGRHKLRSVK